MGLGNDQVPTGDETGEQTMLPGCPSDQHPSPKAHDSTIPGAKQPSEFDASKARFGFKALRTQEPQDLLLGDSAFKFSVWQRMKYRCNGIYNNKSHKVRVLGYRSEL